MAADYIREKLNIKLFLPRGRSGNKKLGVLAFEDNQQDAGFTLLEMIVVAIMVGILGAIAAPGWLGFVNRQRVNKANDTVLSALQQAQREAKKTKLDYSVSFRTNNKIPQVAIYPGTTPSNWQNLGGGEENQAKQIVLGTNLLTNNSPTLNEKNINTTKATVTFSATPTQTIKFDQMGILAPKTNNNPSDIDLKIVVAVPNPSNPASPTNVKRCVIVKTLLATTITQRDDDCD
jgi:prepilin-type N-terminal cleavage/methylation domain-containing protein